MPAELFVDTSAWFPLADPHDASHAAVARALRRAVAAGKRVVSTNLVIAETHALLVRRIHRGAALAFLREVEREPNVIVRSTAEHETAARCEWIERCDDQGFTLTDAVSFAVMADRGISEALALDRHFAVAGFEVVPAR